MKKGWGWPGLSKKAHYFVDGRALCGKWLFFGPIEDVTSTAKGPDDCAACHKKRAGAKEAKT
jgi:hypothetical protein